MKMYYYNGMVLFVSGVSGKGQLRLKDLFSRLHMKNCLIYIQNRKSTYLCNVNEQLCVQHSTTTHQKAKWATETQTSNWSDQRTCLDSTGCSAQCPLLLYEICTPVPFSNYPALRQLTACFLPCKGDTFGFLQGKGHFGKYQSKIFFFTCCKISLCVCLQRQHVR